MSERDFLEYYRSEGIDAWLCRLGLPDAFVLGRPVFDSGRTRATIQVRVIGGHSPGAGAPTLPSFQVVKEGTTWKLILPEDIVAEIKTRPSRRSHQVSATGMSDGVAVYVTAVDLYGTGTTAHLRVSNLTGVEIGLELGMTRLRSSGGTAATLTRSSLPQRMAPRAQVSGTLTFGPLPVESRELRLTLQQFIVRGSAVSLDLPITLTRCP